MFYAEMESEHYTWRAFGKSAQAARVLIAEAFIVNTMSRNMDRETAIDYIAVSCGGEADLADEHDVAGALNDYYGINTVEVTVGTALQDWHQLVG